MRAILGDHHDEVEKGRAGVPSATATRSLVDAAVSTAMARVLPAEPAGSDPLVRRSERADFQSTVALANPAGRPPRDIAAYLAAAIDTVTATGPGFLNLTVRDTTLWQSLATRLGDPQLGVETTLVDDDGCGDEVYLMLCAYVLPSVRWGHMGCSGLPQVDTGLQLDESSPTSAHRHDRAPWGAERRSR